jgi:hypothetical protein
VRALVLVEVCLRWDVLWGAFSGVSADVAEEKKHWLP